MLQVIDIVAHATFGTILTKSSCYLLERTGNLGAMTVVATLGLNPERHMPNKSTLKRLEKVGGVEYY
jgi:hypothetical protein